MKQYYKVSFFIIAYSCFAISEKATSSVNQTHKTVMSSFCLDAAKKRQLPLLMDLSTNYYWNEVIENTVDKRKLSFDKKLPTNLRFFEVHPGCGRMQNR